MPKPLLSVVVLAAGEGKRMRSATPKVLHPVAGEPMIGHVLAAARALEPAAIHVVHGHGGEQVQARFDDNDLHWAHQAEQLGTGHAVAQAMPAIADDHQVLVLCGDVPLIQPDTLRELVDAAGREAGLLSVVLDDPSGYGRILRDTEGAVAGIVEDKDATAEQRQVTEINTGILCLPAGRLRGWLACLDAGNAQGELYLTDCIAMARADGVAVHGVRAADPWEVQGVNDRVQLAAVERACQRRSARRLMRDDGVALADPARFDLRGRLVAGQDCRIDVDVIIEGEVVLGDGVEIGPFTRLRDTRIGAGTQILGHCEIEASDIGAGARIGPFARLRPRSVLGDAVRVGNFVETKNVAVATGSKLNHLSYLGDADIGEGVNVGAGTITCNYDGRHKHLTRIGDRVFIGSNTALVAPIQVGHDVTIGAGTTLRDDVAADSLAVDATRPRQIKGWRPDDADQQSGD